MDTIELIAKAKGKRKLMLHLNTNHENYAFSIQVETAALPIKTYKFSLGFITHFLMIPFLIGIIPIVLHITKLVSLSNMYYGFVLVWLPIPIFIVVCLLNFVSSLIDRDLKKILTLTGSLTIGLSIMCIYFLSIDNSYEKSNFPQFYAWLNTYRIFIYGSAFASASWLGYLFFYPSIDRQRKISAYRRKEEHLIKP
ncbi:hypothetical protein [Pseudanabaena sp. 'Roaring Creek']|uniref:hypothetical protein n=1 Tax=Pseudanabaena sp. 'Roaring Creek' TaxID=1681830 RepID=UPI0006D7B430|nr:hypothetical protein [Pseudanabaena sp. 'Roaring Creek']